MRFDTPEGKIELPVKLRVHDSIFVPLAKWSMLLAGNYRCITKDGMRTAQEAVHTNIEESRSVYNFVFDLCVKLGATPSDLVPFEKYAAAAQSLTRPASAARALQNGAPNIERADKLVQLIAKQKGMSNPVDRRASSRWSTARLEANRKKAAARLDDRRLIRNLSADRSPRCGKLDLGGKLRVRDFCCAGIARRQIVTFPQQLRSF